LGCALVAVVMAGLARPAIAGNPAAESEALIRQGLQLRAQGKPGRALPIFEKAYETAPSPRTAAHLGLVEMELGHFLEAERYLTEALAAPDHPWIAKNKPDLGRQLEDAKRNIGELAISATPAGAEILVNGLPAGHAPLAAPVRVDKGRAEVQVRANGYVPTTETVTIVGGKREQRSFALAPDPTVARAPAVTEPPPAASGTTLGSSAAPSNATATATATATPGVERAQSAPASNTGVLRVSALIAGGVAVAALAFGTLEVFSAASAQDAFNNHMGMVGGAYGKDCGTGSLSEACKPLKDDYDRAITFSIVGFAAAGALAAGASVLFLLSRNGTAEPAGAAQAFGCVPDVVSRGVSCSLRF